MRRLNWTSRKLTYCLSILSCGQILPSNSGKWRFGTGSPYSRGKRLGGDCYWVWGRSNFYQISCFGLLYQKHVASCLADSLMCFVCFVKKHGPPQVDESYALRKLWDFATRFEWVSVCNKHFNRFISTLNLWRLYLHFPSKLRECMAIPNGNFLFQPLIFRGKLAVGFREDKRSESLPGNVEVLHLAAARGWSKALDSWFKKGRSENLKSPMIWIWIPMKSPK